MNWLGPATTGTCALAATHFCADYADSSTAAAKADLINADFTSYTEDGTQNAVITATTADRCSEWWYMTAPTIACVQFTG